MAAGLFPPMSCWACSNISCRCDHLRNGRGARRLVREIDWLNGVSPRTCCGRASFYGLPIATAFCGACCYFDYYPPLAQIQNWSSASREQDGKIIGHAWVLVDEVSTV